MNTAERQKYLENVYKEIDELSRFVKFNKTALLVVVSENISEAMDYEMNITEFVDMCRDILACR